MVDNQNGDKYEYKDHLVFRTGNKLWIKTCPVSVSGKDKWIDIDEIWKILAMIALHRVIIYCYVLVFVKQPHAVLIH